MNKPSCRLQQVAFAVGKKQILEPMTLDIEAGKVTAILGPNGSGKSTLLKLLSGLVQASSGEVQINGQRLANINRRERAKILTMLPQHSPVPLGMKVEELVACGRHPYASAFGRLSANDHEAIQRALTRVDMQQYATDRVDHLSGGEMQRVWLAMVLAQETGILLLDEPTSWLDIAHQLRLLDIVRTLNEEEKITVVWILHDLNQALQYSDNIVLMNHGRLVRSGRAEEVLDEAVIREVFGVNTGQYRLNGSQQTLFIPIQESEKAVSEKAVSGIPSLIRDVA